MLPLIRSLRNSSSPLFVIPTPWMVADPVALATVTLLPLITLLLSRATCGSWSRKELRQLHLRPLTRP